MKRLRWMFLGLLGLGITLLLGGCFPGPAGPGAPAPPGVGLLCLVPLAIGVILAVIVAVVVYLVWNKEAGGVSQGLMAKKPAMSAEEIARRRYASGEITYEELQEILRHLEETRERGAA